MTKRVHVHVLGLVQGVFFRAATRDKALSLGLHGWVRNLRDGSVEIVAEGNSAAIAEFLDWCRVGPPRARVEQCDVNNETPLGDCTGFEVRGDR